MHTWMSAQDEVLSHLHHAQRPSQMWPCQELGVDTSTLDTHVAVAHRTTQGQHTTGKVVEEERVEVEHTSSSRSPASTVVRMRTGAVMIAKDLTCRKMMVMEDR